MPSLLTTLQQQDKDIQAWAYLPASLPPAHAGPLQGLTFGVKDVLDVTGMPTCYGAHFPDRSPALFDASCVAQLRAAGALPVGKTVTAEFAFAAPGPTKNPVNPSHTPGGSSSGSAAAVAAGMVDFALGTQTGGSMIRPAAFTGILGFKPSFQSVHRNGLFLICDTLDTIGWFARDLPTLHQVSAALLPAANQPQPTTQRLAVMNMDGLSQVDPTSKALLSAQAQRWERAGYQISFLETDAQAPELLSLHSQIMRYEMARALLPVWQDWPDALRKTTTDEIQAGLALSPRDYDSWQIRRRELQHLWSQQYEQYDALITPSAPGPAPAGLESTGSSVLNRIWSLLGWPTLNLPCGYSQGLPLGLQLIGRPHQDRALLDLAACLAAHLPQAK